jgi:hypothetical protein
VSDPPFSKGASTGADAGDESIQSNWDRFAAREASDGRKRYRSPRAQTVRKPTKATLAMSANDPPLENWSMTARSNPSDKEERVDHPEEKSDN